MGDPGIEPGMGHPGGVTVRCRTLQLVALFDPEVTTVRLIVKKKLTKRFPPADHARIKCTHYALADQSFAAKNIDYVAAYGTWQSERITHTCNVGAMALRVPDGSPCRFSCLRFSARKSMARVLPEISL